MSSSAANGKESEHVGCGEPQATQDIEMRLLLGYMTDGPESAHWTYWAILAHQRCNKNTTGCMELDVPSLRRSPGQRAGIFVVRTPCVRRVCRHERPHACPTTAGGAGLYLISRPCWRVSLALTILPQFISNRAPGGTPRRRLTCHPTYIEARWRQPPIAAFLCFRQSTSATAAFCSSVSSLGISMMKFATRSPRSDGKLWTGMPSFLTTSFEPGLVTPVRSTETA